MNHFKVLISPYKDTNNSPTEDESNKENKENDEVVAKNQEKVKKEESTYNSIEYG